MGQNIEIKHFTESDYKKFSKKLYDNLNALEQCLSRPEFGEGSITLGAELETYIVNKNHKISPINDAILNDLKDPLFQHELNKFNLEYNLLPVPAKGKPFSKMKADIDNAMLKASHVAHKHNSAIVPIGILPTLDIDNFNADYMTDIGRYHMLSDGLHKMRGEAFKININGDDPIQLECDHVTLEGANTSLQIHLRIEPHKFADSYNTTQVVTSLAVALSGNSPTLMGHKLWHETRIALFKQSIDSRLRNEVNWRQPSRVSFGHGWVRKNALELFKETVALYPPIIPYLFEKNNQNENELPKLAELNLHMGTIWPWNRAVYSSQDEGHLRIEMRALPSGPTSIDMMAGAAFFIGLVIGLRDKINDILPALPFRFAEYNFYRAAQMGLEANILWPMKNQNCPTGQPICEVIKSLLPYMEKGLSILEVDPQEIQIFKNNINDRLLAKRTGSIWQLGMIDRYETAGFNRNEACHAMIKKYIELQKTFKPVVEWDLNL
ncbi:MAG: DUF3091 domain-containing protein [Emcibacter sp.]|nr:DUF3091 domain-containing protein [Emcibacter sp.]